ncbi:MAG: hypothetical protein AAF492_21475 [Verrucomicrobiota bacterium]
MNSVIKNNETRKIGFEKAESGDQSIEIHNNAVLKIGNSKSADGSQTIEIYKDRTTTLETGNESLQVKKGNREVKVDTGNDSTTIKTGDYTLKISSGKGEVSACQSFEIKVGASTIKMTPGDITIKSPTIKIQADGKLDAQSPMTTVKGDGMLTLKGGLVKIN